MRRALLLLLLAAPALAGEPPRPWPEVPAPAASTKTLTLDEALAQAKANLPALEAARAGADAASARARQAFAPLLPGLSLGLGYSRSTANYAPRPGAVPSSVSTASTISLDSTDYFSGSVQLSGTLWDFGKSWSRYQAPLSQAEAQAAAVHTAELSARLQVKSAYFQAVARKQLVEVARATLANTEAHLQQIEGFVSVGSRPDIDLAQSRADRANARLALVNATTGYALAKAQLNQTMGVGGPTDYEVVATAPGAVQGESATVEALLPEALSARPEVRALDKQLDAQRSTLAATRAGYWPTLSAQLGLSAGARTLDAPVPNGSLGVNLSWPLYEGGVTKAQELEASASLRQLQAQRQALAAEVRLGLETALLSVEAAHEAVDVAGEALEAAAERLRLAEGRYQAGAGSVIELGDAQVAATQAAAQQVQAQLNLATARAQLEAALGR